MQEDSAAAESDGDDDELLMAASAWASTQNEEVDDNDASPKKERPKEGKDGAKSKPHASPKNQRSTKPLHNASHQQTYSLHLTKVPYDATQSSIRFAFGEKGCHVTSVRLVYDHDAKTGEKHFRGVAFVDLADEMSYKRGLEFNMKRFLGKKMKVNVRPTRTKGQLSDIVRRTEEKVATLIARSKDTAKREREDGDSNDKGKDSVGTKKRKKDKKTTGGHAVKTETQAAERAENSDKREAKKGRDKKKQAKPSKRNDAKSDKGDSSKTEAQTNKPKPSDPQEANAESDEKKKANSKKSKSEKSNELKPESPKQDDTQQGTEGSEEKKQTKPKNGKEAKSNRRETPTAKSKNKDTPNAIAVAKINNQTGSKTVTGGSKPKKRGGPPEKLTKKQRAKKAAVIRMMRMRG